MFIMRKIILVSLFFCLSITTVLAQVATINIATPNSNGLSNNQVDDFDVNTDGTILNNSASDGTAQLGNTGLAANNNITGSEADLILLQVTGTSGSGLDGTIEVFGGEAGLIIANPNGIDCDGCGFINTSKVDLVTGTANFSGDDFTGFSIDGSSTLTVSGSGFLSDAVADELKLESQNISINAQVRANNSLEIIVNNYTQSGAIDVIGDISIQVTSEARLDDNASIQSSNLFFSAYDFYNQADLTIEDNATFDIGNDFQNGFRLNRTDYDGGDISANNFNVAAGGYFYNYNATINANDFNVVAGDYFYNIDSATISADNFNVTAGNDFYNDRSATINANDFNVTAGRFFYNHSFATINANNFNVIAGDYFYNHNSATINVNNFNVTAGYNFSNRYSSTINADNFNVTAGNDFDNYATINADSFNVTLKGNYSYFDNRDNATINADSFNVTADSFFNETNSTITANECNIIYTTSYTDNGTITCNDEIEVIDIARPDANGLSNNSYTDFNILNSGIVLNNSDSAGTSQLAGDISANTNYNSGDAASLILAQITGNDISLLEGALEAFGAEAGVINNPSGITCIRIDCCTTIIVKVISCGNIEVICTNCCRIYVVKVVSCYNIEIIRIDCCIIIVKVASCCNIEVISTNIPTIVICPIQTKSILKIISNIKSSIVFNSKICLVVEIIS